MYSLSWLSILGKPSARTHLSTQQFALSLVLSWNQQLGTPSQCANALLYFFRMTSQVVTHITPTSLLTSPGEPLVTSCSFGRKCMCMHPNGWAAVPCLEHVHLCDHAQTISMGQRFWPRVYTHHDIYTPPLGLKSHQILLMSWWISCEGNKNIYLIAKLILMQKDFIVCDDIREEYVAVWCFFLTCMCSTVMWGLLVNYISRWHVQNKPCYLF